MGQRTILTSVTLYDGANHALTRYDGNPASSVFAYHENLPAALDAVHPRFGFATGGGNYQPIE